MTAKTNTMLRQVNESLYELYKPEGNPTMQVLFFHGLQFVGASDAHVRTWTSEGGSIVWPWEWLVETFPGAQVFTVSYNEGVRNMDMLPVGEKLTADLLAGKIGLVPYCPVIMVGYCVGGLVIKSVCLQARNKLNSGKASAIDGKKLGMFLDNVKGIFYYGAPHRGISHIANVGDGPLFKYFKILNTEAALLNSQFDDLLVSYPKWKVCELGESLPTISGLFKGHVVLPESAAREGELNVVQADHNTICQPRNTEDRRFYALTDLIESIMASSKEEAQVQEETSLQEAPPQNFQYLPEDRLVGVDALVQIVVGKLDNVKKLGFGGMGGLGKTTLAQAVFNHLGSTFEYTCFVPNMKLIAGTEEGAKAAVWEHLHHHGKKVDGEQNWRRLKGKPALVVLDDICLRDEKVLHDLARLFPESRFIATSRDQELLSSLDEVFDIPFLEGEAAKLLFMHCAFPEQMEAPQKMEIVVNEIVKTCDGLPLTLEVLGKYLRKKNAKEWEETLIALKMAEAISSLDERLWAKLRPSYSDLTKKEQEIFLDASTFFCRATGTGVTRVLTLRAAKAAWRAAYDASAGLLWQTLVDRSLVYSVKEDEPIKVHEQLQCLGQKIASERSNIGKTRVSDGEVGLRMIQNTTEDLDGMAFHALRMGQPGDGQSINIRGACAKLRKLQFLDSDIPNDGCTHDGYIPTELVLLKCNGPNHFNPALQMRLVVLSLNWQVRDPLPSSIGGLQHLEHLTISSSFLEILPNSFGQLRSLQHLTICHVPKLKSLPDSFRQLGALQHLTIDGATQLECLPQSFGQLGALQHLTITSAGQLECLPESFGQLGALQHLTITSAGQLERLPESFGQLEALQHLTIDGARQLKSLPQSFGQLGALQHLTIYGVGQLKSLPESFGQLGALQHLTINRAEQLKSLPQSFGQLAALQHLTIDGARQLKNLPQSFGQLGALQHLTIDGAGQLKSLPESFGELGALQHLTIDGARQLECLPQSFGQLGALQHLTIDGATQLESLPESFGQLGALQHLTINQPGWLKSLPESFGQLGALQHLTITWATQLESLPESFGQLGALQHLTINQPGRLKSLPESFGQLGALQHLTITWARHLECLPESFGQLGALQNLTINRAEQLESLPKSFGQLGALQHLTIDGARQLECLPQSFGQLGALQHLTITSAGQLECLPESFGQLGALQHLTITSAGQLERLPESFGQLEALQHLTIDGARQLKSLPQSFGQLGALQHLTIYGAGQLKSLPESFGQLGALQHLTIILAGQLECLPESFGQLGALQHLTITSIGQLERLPQSFGQLGALQHLTIDGAGQLKSLPQSFGELWALQHLTIDGAGQLKSLPESFGELGALQHLTITWAGQLERLPESFGQLGALQSLTIYSIKQWESLPMSGRAFRSMERSTTVGAGHFKNLPKSSGQLGALQHLTIDGVRAGVRELKRFRESFGQLREDSDTISGTNMMDYESEGLFQTPHCTPAHNDICPREPNLVSTSDNTGTSGRIQQTTFNAANYGGTFNRTSKTDPGHLSVSEVRPLLPSSRAHSDPAGSAPALSNETYDVESWNSLVDVQAEASFGSSDELILTLRTAVKDLSILYSYCISTQWLCTLNPHQIEDLYAIFSKAGYLETYKTRTKAYFEYVESHAANNPSNQRETHNTSNNNTVNDTERFSELLQSGNLLPTNTQGLNTGFVDFMNTAHSSPKADAKCVCPRKLLTVSFTPLSYGPEGPSSQGEPSRTELCRDCDVTMPEVRKGYVMATSVKKDIEVTISDLSTRTEFPFNFKVSATTILSCCLRRDLDNKQVRIELLRIGGALNVAESSHADNPALVLKAVRTDLKASLNNSENSILGSQEIHLALRTPQKDPSERKVLKSFSPRNNRGQIQPPEDLLWLEFSDIEPFDDELGSTRLELACKVHSRLQMDMEETSSKALSLNDITPVHFEGQIDGDLDPNSFVEFNLRYQVEISYLVDFSSRILTDARCHTCTRVNKKIDFDCVLKFRTAEIFS